jgi:ribosomal protein S18 acetylase RimI-like enzyme
MKVGVALLLFLSCALEISADETFVTKSGKPIELQEGSSKEISVDDQRQVKQLFVEAFAKSYRLSGAHFALSDLALQRCLESDFDRSMLPLFSTMPPKTYLAARAGDRLVGYAFFEELAEDTVYVAELGIASDFWRQGLGRKMTLYYAEHHPAVKKIVLLTERINLQAQKFYESIGFESSNSTREGYPPDRFLVYEKRVR